MFEIPKRRLTPDETKMPEYDDKEGKTKWYIMYDAERIEDYMKMGGEIEEMLEDGFKNYKEDLQSLLSISFLESGQKMPDSFREAKEILSNIIHIAREGVLKYKAEGKPLEELKKKMDALQDKMSSIVYSHPDFDE